MSNPNSIRLPEDIEKRVLKLNKKTSISKHALMTLAIRAGIDSVEKNLLNIYEATHQLTPHSKQGSVNG